MGQREVATTWAEEQGGARTLPTGSWMSRFSTATFRSPAHTCGSAPRRARGYAEGLGGSLPSVTRPRTTGFSFLFSSRKACSALSHCCVR